LLFAYLTNKETGKGLVFDNFPRQFHFLSRLWTNRYVGVFDKDEFIVPRLQNPIQGALKSLLVRHRWSKLISLRSDCLIVNSLCLTLLSKRNLKQCWSKIQLISTKPTTTSKLNARKKMHEWTHQYCVMCNYLRKVCLLSWIILICNYNIFDNTCRMTSSCHILWQTVLYCMF
jgi:hypothetical protein